MIRTGFMAKAYDNGYEAVELESSVKLHLKLGKFNDLW